jgi:hypothetical protein
MARHVVGLVLEDVAVPEVAADVVLERDDVRVTVPGLRSRAGFDLLHGEDQYLRRRCPVRRHGHEILFELRHQ